MKYKKIILSKKTIVSLLIIWISLFFFEYSYNSIILRGFEDKILIYFAVISYKILIYGSLLLLLFYLPLKNENILPSLMAFLFFSLFRIYYGGSITNLISSLPIFVLTFYVARNLPYGFNRAICILIIINFIIICMQFLGLHESFYYLSHSSHDSIRSFSFLQKDGYLPQHQHRPHGLFASTIQLSLFEIFVLVILLLQKEICIIFYIIFGVTLILTGSTTSILLCIISLLLVVLNRKMAFVIISGVVTYLLCMKAFPFFLQSNYSIDLVFSRFDSRLNIENTHSFLTYAKLIPSTKSLIIIFMTICSLLVFIIINYSIYYAAHLLVGLSIILVPLLLHPILNDMRYTFLFAYITSNLFYLKLEKLPRNVSFHNTKGFHTA